MTAEPQIQQVNGQSDLQHATTETRTESHTPPIIITIRMIMQGRVRKDDSDTMPNERA